MTATAKISCFVLVVKIWLFYHAMDYALNASLLGESQCDKHCKATTSSAIKFNEKIYGY
jgi:hypothetical protein